MHIHGIRPIGANSSNACARKNRANRQLTIHTLLCQLKLNIAQSRTQLKKIGVAVNDALPEKVVKELGITNQSRDTSLVSATDP